MAKTVKERVRDWRDRKSRQGGRSLSAWLEPETARMFRKLQDRFGEGTSTLIARAIETLYLHAFAADAGEAPPPTPSAGRRRETALQSPEFQAESKLERAAVEPPVGSVNEPPAPPVEPEAPPVPSLTPAPDAGPRDPMLAEIVARLEAGTAFRELRDTLLPAWMNAMKAQGMDYQAMAEELNRAGIPTLTGKGLWQAGMIPAFLLIISTHH